MGTLLEIREIQASYKEYPALKGVSLAIKENTVMGLVGESGSGKSTLAKVITGLLKKDAGEILFEESLMEMIVEAETAHNAKNSDGFPKSRRVIKSEAHNRKNLIRCDVVS